jgi:hypothetical protein
MKLRAAIAALALLCAPTTSARAESPFARSANAEAPTPLARDFAAPSLEVARRLAIAALQDLGLALESASNESGAITASRLDAHPVRLTVTIAAKSEGTVIAAVTTDYANAPLADPRPAEAFFTAYAKALSPPPEID